MFVISISISDSDLPLERLQLTLDELTTWLKSILVLGFEVLA